MSGSLTRDDREIVLGIPGAWATRNFTWHSPISGIPITDPTWLGLHYSDANMGAIASRITGVAIVYSTVCSDIDQRKTAKLCVTDLCEGNSTVTDEFPAQRGSNTENVSI